MPAPAVSLFAGPPNEGWTQVFANDAAGNPEYIGIAHAKQPSFEFTVTAVSKANPAEFTTSAAHGLATDNPVVIAGATAGWAGINGTRIVTVTAADKFTVAVDSSAFAGAFDGTVTTTAPRTTAPCWSIEKRVYDAAAPNPLLSTRYANGSPADNQIFDNRASLAYQ
jgi:hypothetical protein